MGINLCGRHFLKLLDFTPQEIRYLLDLAKDFKALKRAGIPHDRLRGKNIVLLFEKTSTRTRCSFEVAGHDLGLGVTYLDPSSSQMGKKESIKDTARVIGRMFDGIEYRGYTPVSYTHLDVYKRQATISSPSTNIGATCFSNLSKSTGLSFIKSAFSKSITSYSPFYFECSMRTSRL